MNAGYLRAPWGLLHYRTAGTAKAADRPLLVMMHQSPLSSRRYREALHLLAGFCTPVAVDTPGYGQSEAGAGEWTVDRYAGVAWFVADAFGAERPWLFGRATGAVFAVHAAAQRPGQAAGVVLHGVPVYTEEEKASRLAEFAPPYDLANSGSHLDRIWRRVTDEYPWAGPALVTDLVLDYLHAGPDFASSYRAIWRHDLHASVRAAGPVDLLLAGDADRIGYMHERAVGGIEHRAAVVLPDATDFVAEQDPAAFCRALAGVIQDKGTGNQRC
ncbi:alpha/beta fold hydrolase [Actinophytocola algeriensis]|uniref:Pimeloyl-ACP methyl ester carboxylesterase n=1 Tax=Actinophytocola algeriensis TaxID=1768010 RepID=A0A7W7VFT5_9PSEU|nr:alpha/beta hydrolase [Actinophytocola algeriensis]MBB4908641.1 pimeloyl-ACP methyl ester carboxylesterase [Actinophytocola algeriensis]MBE1474972.1 pimeloyl-ACP methyl ester carboxylesterase [Actinophytocola algeriensis]